MNTEAQDKVRHRYLNGIFFTFLLLFILAAIFVRNDPQNFIDQQTERYLHPSPVQQFLPVLTAVTFFGSFEFLFPAYLVLIIVMTWRKRRRLALTIAIVALGGFLSVEMFKQIFKRFRPASPLIRNVPDFSFPSGHSASSFIFCAVLAALLWHSAAPKPLRMAGIIFLFMLALMVAVSRILLSVHYPTDVAAGFCLGIVWAAGWYRAVFAESVTEKI